MFHIRKERIEFVRVECGREYPHSLHYTKKKGLNDSQECPNENEEPKMYAAYISGPAGWGRVVLQYIFE